MLVSIHYFGNESSKLPKDLSTEKVMGIRALFPKPLKYLVILYYVGKQPKCQEILSGDSLLQYFRGVCAFFSPLAENFSLTSL